MASTRLLHAWLAVLVIAIVIFSTVVLLRPSVGGFPTHVLGAYHPVAMTIGFAAAMTGGLTSYVINVRPSTAARACACVRACVCACTPLCACLCACARVQPMHRFPTRESRRVIHGGFNMLAAMFIAVGYLLHFTYAQITNNSHFGMGELTWRKCHSILGLITVCGVMLQVVIGLYKFVVRTRDGESIMKWHGYLGLLVWVCGLVNIAVGFFGWFHIEQKFTGVAVSMTVLLALLLATVLAVIYNDPERKRIHMDARYDDDNIFNEQRTSMGSLNSKPLLM